MFWKPKIKLLSKKENKSIQNINVENVEPIIKEECKYKHITESQIVLPLHLKKAYSFHQDTAHFERLSGLKFKTKRVKSYPVSPRQTFLGHREYLSDQNLHTMSRYNSNYKPRATLGSSEPFPFEVPRDSAPRQSLFYEFRYGDTDSAEVNDNSQYEAEKPLEEFGNQNTYGRATLSRPSTYKHQLHNQDNLESQNVNSSIRRTVVHVRPASVHKTPKESMQVQAVRNATSPNRSVVRQFQLKPKNKTSLLMTNEGKVLHPVKTDKVRTSFLRSNNQIPPPVRVSVVKPLEREDADPTMPLRKSFCRSSFRHSQAMNRDVEAEKLNRSSVLSEREASPPYVGYDENLDMFPEMPGRNSIRDSIGLARESQGHNDVVNNQFPFAQTENEPVVYAVPVVPTRGRTKSLLQQSVKSLASKNQREDPGIYRKNIRYSMDTDVFSAETRRRSISPASPGFVNMERGQPMLVSEVLNPITSLFISDLKNPVPKDPITKPKEGNVWVKPRRVSTQRSSFSKPPTKVVKPPVPTTRAVPVQRRLSRKSRYNYQEESSSSDESIVVYTKKSKHSAPRRSYHQAVYAAQLPDHVLPQHDYKHRSSLCLPTNVEQQVCDAQASSSKDTCGLTLRRSEQKIFEDLQSPNYVKRVSSGQQTDIEDELDLICYPSESVLKKSVVSSESGSKLRWRIIIKREEEK